MPVFAWLIISILLVALMLQFLWRSGRQRNRALRREPLKPTLFTLKLGDIVQYDVGNWVVEDCLKYKDEEGYVWLEYMLQDRDDIRWLSVEEDDRVEVSWMKVVTDLEIDGTPPKHIDYGGTSYRLKEFGVAKVERTARVLHNKPDTCHYFDYMAPGGKVLSVERWNTEIEVTVGEEIPSHSLSLLPGDGQRVYDD